MLKTLLGRIRQPNVVAILAYYAGFVINGLVMASLGPILPALADQTHIPLDQAGILITSRSVGYLAGALLAGRLFDRFPGHRPMVTAMLLNIILLAAIPLVTNLPIMVLIMVLTGLTVALFDVGSNTLLVWRLGSRVPPYMNALHFSFGVGALIAPLIIASLLKASLPASWVNWAIAVLILPVPVILSRISAPPHPVHKGDGSPLVVPSAGLIINLAFIFMLYVGLEVAFTSWLYTYSIKMELANTISAAYLTSIYFAAFTLGRLISILIVTRLRPLSLIKIDLAGMALAFTALFIFRSSAVALWISTALAGITMASFYPTTISYAGRHLTLVPRITGRFLIGGSLGAMSIPWMIGLLIGADYTASIMAIFAVIVVSLGTAFAAFLVRLNRNAGSSNVSPGHDSV